jgi:hypothetical protein
VKNKLLKKPQYLNCGFFRSIDFRVAINPVFGKGFFWPYYGGVSFGYKFKNGFNVL